MATTQRNHVNSALSFFHEANAAFDRQLKRHGNGWLARHGGVIQRVDNVEPGLVRYHLRFHNWHVRIVLESTVRRLPPIERDRADASTVMVDARMRRVAGLPTLGVPTLGSFVGLGWRRGWRDLTRGAIRPGEAFPAVNAADAILTTLKTDHEVNPFLNRRLSGKG